MGQAKQRGTFEERLAQAQGRASVGQIDILNTGMGHSEIKVDNSNAIELERSARIIEDMLRRGYALFVHGKGDELVKVKRFDKKHKVYIIGAEATLAPETESFTSPVVGKRGRKSKEEKAVPMAKAHVTSIGRSAGG